MCRHFPYFISFITLLFPLQTTSATVSPTVQEIVQRAVERSESQLTSGVEAEFDSLVLTLVHAVDADGTITKTESSLYSRYPLHGAIYEELIEKEGRPLDEGEARAQAKKRDKFIREVTKRLAEGKSPQPDDKRRVTFDSEFMSRYKATLVGRETLREHSCWVIRFEPREGKLPVKRRMDEALNRSTGRLWISQEDYGLVRVEFEMREPIRYLAGLLATIRNTVGRLEFDRIESDVWFPTDFELKLDMRILFKNIRRNVVRNWREYRRSDPSSIPPSRVRCPSSELRPSLNGVLQRVSRNSKSFHISESPACKFVILEPGVSRY
jgi:hypothetical protein